MEGREELRKGYFPSVRVSMHLREIREDRCSSTGFMLMHEWMLACRKKFLLVLLVSQLNLLTIELLPTVNGTKRELQSTS